MAVKDKTEATFFSLIAVICVVVAIIHSVKDESSQPESTQNTLITHQEHDTKCSDSEGYVVPCWIL